MNSWLYLVVGLALGIWLAQYFLRNKDESGTNSMIDDEQKLKEEHMLKVQEYLKGKDEVTNDEIEKLLHISDATTTRYLDDLEHQGLIKQMGKTGQSVHYKVL